jgi:hypothetical protein
MIDGQAGAALPDGGLREPAQDKGAEFGIAGVVGGGTSFLEVGYCGLVLTEVEEQPAGLSAETCVDG